MLSQVERHVRVTVLEIMNNEWYTGCETPKLSQIIYELYCYRHSSFNG